MSLEVREVDAFYSDKGFERLQGEEATPDNADVMFYSGFHAARKGDGLQPVCQCGRGKRLMYSSKCGRDPRIEHVHNQLNDGPYGSPVLFYKRR